MQSLKKKMQREMEQALRPHKAHLPAHSTKPLTVPLEFHFQTEDRICQHHAIMNTSTSSEDTSTTKLNTDLAKPWNPRPTVPEPFVLQSECRAKQRLIQSNLHDGIEEIVPLAEQINKLEKEMPGRFRSKPDVLPPAKMDPNQVTRPVQFHFETEARYRPATALSSAQMEEIELAQVPKFKARPLDPRIFESAGDLGVPRVPKPPPTEPLQVHFATEERSRKRPRQNEEHTTEGESRCFKARKLNPRILSGETASVKPPHRIELTVPQSPAFALKKRAAEREKRHTSRAAKLQKKLKKFKALQMPIGSPFRLQPSQKSLTQTIPFDLHTDIRGEGYARRLKDEIEQEEKRLKEARCFKAQPIVEFDFPRSDQPYELKPLTEPKTPNLESIRRHRVSVQQFQQVIEQEQRQLEEMRRFKAQPILIAEPFVPQRSAKPLTLISEFELNSENRAQARHKFDEMLAEKERAAEEARQNRLAREKLEEARQLSKLRKALEFKANPVPTFEEVFQPKPSDKPLTEPKTPQLVTKLRSSQRQSHNGSFTSAGERSSLSSRPNRLLLVR